jgi:hypothetical protein
MSIAERTKELSRLIAHSANNWTTLAGVVLTTGSGISLVWFWFMELTSSRAVNPYMGLLLFMILPAVFVAGLALIPLGLWFRRRKQRKAGSLPTEYPKLDFSSPSARRLFLLLGLATAANITILGTASYKGIDYMDSSKFCGLTCHTPMTPEYTAFLNSPHSRVGCAQCHVGPGAEGFVRAKLSGMHQVYGVIFNSYSRPIPSPVETLRPARETCEQCHWPQKFTGDKLIIRTKYADDEANTATTSVVLLKIGGVTSQGQVGIHGRHLDSASRISYITTDPKRMAIPKVTYRDDSGQLVDYLAEDAKPEALAAGHERKMDCIDCHNRPTHTFEVPERALDKAIKDGLISPTLPFVKKQATLILKRDYPDQPSASKEIPNLLEAFYKASYPDVLAQKKALIDQAGEAVKAIYLRNVFPEMNLKWGEHPNMIGHEESLGCFRCHDGSHTAKGGKTIAADCNTCHILLAQDEKDPKILKDLGVN